VKQQSADKEMAFLKTSSQFQRAKFLLRDWQGSLSGLHAQNVKHVGVRVGSVPGKLWQMFQGIWSEMGAGELFPSSG
jgi:hypothetical protein